MQYFLLPVTIDCCAFFQDFEQKQLDVPPDKYSGQHEPPKDYVSIDLCICIQRH